MRKNQNGVAMIEMAITISILILIVMGITEFGRAIYQYNTLAKAVRDSARYLSTQDAGNGSGQTVVAKNLTVCGKTAGCTNTDSDSLVSGLKLTMITVEDASTSLATHKNISTGTGVVNLVTVTVSGFTFNSVVSALIPDIAFGPISVTMRQAT